MGPAAARGPPRPAPRPPAATGPPEHLTPAEKGHAYAPSNIALIKYWGKRNPALNLPHNSSLSISLADHGTHTTLTPAAHDTLTLNGNPIAADTPFYRRTFAFVDLIRRHTHHPLAIDTRNTIPTAAGLASSASGYAALTLALNQYFQLNLPASTLSALARIGSGSAARSLWHGYVQWQRGEREDGADSIAHPIATDWHDLRIALLPIDTREKNTPSRSGMNHTTATSPLYPAWPHTAETDLRTLRQAIAEHDYTTLGQTAEANALAMHATMLAARPALIYLQEASLRALNRIRELRADGLEHYATIDAGPNLKLLYHTRDETDIAHAWPQATRINPFTPNTQAKESP
ncbi:MAG: diphosphomevalonate decarboxylase [Cardiobacteriaceae bacterium]|nr:diphosphomevalonate decarboxylase [Cardiobacteriaceae bacterium]